MKRSSLAIVIAFTLILTVLCSCSHIPEEPPVNSVEKFTYVDPAGATVLFDNPKDKSEPVVKYVKTIENVEFSMNSYYVYKKNAASFTVEEFINDGFLRKTSCAVNVKMISIGKRSDNMKIRYRAFDKDGNEIYSSFILVVLKGVKRDDVVQRRRVTFPDGTVKVVFEDFVDPVK